MQPQGTVRMRRRGQRGNALVVVLPFGVLLGFSALALDVGLIRVVDVQLQAALDAATLSAVSELDGTEAGITRAYETANTIASLNTVLQQPLSLSSGDVVVGSYDRPSDTFVPYNTGDDVALVNAVRINHALPPVAAILSGFTFGVSAHNRNSRSMSVRDLAAGPAASARCSLPLAIPDCHLAGLPPGTNPPPIEFSFNPSPSDNIAWGDPTSTSSAHLRDRVADPCSTTIEVGDILGVNNGVHNSVNQLLVSIINGDAPGRTLWDTALYGSIPLPLSGSSINPSDYGHVYEGPVALVDGGPDCTNLDFTGTMTVTQMAWAVIFDVRDSGSPKALNIQLDVVNQHAIWGEGDPNGTGNVLAPGAPALAGW